MAATTIPLVHLISLSHPSERPYESLEHYSWRRAGRFGAAHLLGRVLYAMMATRFNLGRGTHVPLGLPTIDHAQEAGRSLAATHPTIWDPDETVVERIAPSVDSWLRTQPRKTSIAQRVWASLLLLFALVTALPAALMWAGPLAGVELTRPADSTLLWSVVAAWLTAALGTLLAAIGCVTSRARAKTLRAAELLNLRQVVITEALRTVEMRRDLARMERATPPAPAKLPYGVSTRGRVELAATWLRHLGSATTVAPQRTEGIDITCRRYVVRVVDDREDAAAAVREVAGVAAARAYPQGVVFLPGPPPSPETVAFADQTNTALLVLGAEAGTLNPANVAGQDLLAPVSVTEPVLF